MSTGGLFSFNPAAGETPETLKRRRAIAEQLLANATGAPATTIGGGLAALGQAIGGRLALGRVNRAEQAGLAGAAGDFGSLMGGVAAPAAPGDVLSGGGGTDSLSGMGGGIPDVAAQEAYIRASAPKYGVDPDIAVKVARSEGLQPGTWQSNVMGKGGRETSYGPYQLLVGGGLGDEFQRTTGLNAADPGTWKQNIDFALGQAAKQGWTPWHGAAKVGVGSRTGIGGTAPVTDALLGGIGKDTLASPAFDFTPFATGGAAARPDSFSGLQPAMSGGLGAMISSAPPDIQRELKVMSGFRSLEVQAQLFKDAVKEYGSVSAARHNVAPPGRSQHNFGNAIDWSFASKRAREWVHQNAAKFGFTFPLGHEPWHMEVAGARGKGVPVQQSASGIGRALDSTGGGAGGVGVPAVAQALMMGPGEEPIAATGVAADRQIADSLGAKNIAASLGFDPNAKDDYLPVNIPDPAFRPAGGPTPYSAGNTVLGGGSANAGTLTPVPDPNMRPAIAPAAAPEAPPVAATAPAATGVAPVVQALGYDPLPQTSAMPGVGGVQGAGHESLSPSAQAVSQALGGGGGTDTLAGGGGRGFLGRLFGPRPAAGTSPATAALAGGGGGVPSAAATGFSPQAQAAIGVLQNPWANEGQQAVAKAILSQELEQATPQARATLEKTLLDIEQQRNPPKSRDLSPQEVVDRGYNPDRHYRESPTGDITEVPGTARETQTYKNLIVDKNTGELIATIPDPGFRVATPEEAAKYGSVAGQFDLSNGEFHPINPPSSMSLTVNPDGTVSLTQGPGGGKTTEGEAKRTSYVLRAQGALPTLDTYGDALLSFPMQMAESDPTGFLRSMQSPEFQLAYGAGLEFLQAILREDTAAAVTPQETVEYGRVYLPAPGDGPERLEYKRQARRRALEGLKAGLSPDAILTLETASGVIEEPVIEVPSEADAVPAEPAATTGPPPTITDDAAGTKAYDALPSGAKYIGPDGKIRKKR